MISTNRYIRLADKAARLLDDALEKAAEKPLHWLYEENERRALTDEVYAEIEAKRRPEGEGSFITFLDDSVGLDWDAWDTQSKIRDSLSLAPWWETPLRFASHRPVGRVWGSVRNFGQRAVRGWDDTATWGLDTHLCRTLADQLDHLADTTHGWPGDDPAYPEFSDWQADLHKNASRLRGWSTHFEGETILGEDGKPDFPAMNKRDEALYKDAQKGLRWVAKHLGSLWD